MSDIETQTLCALGGHEWGDIEYDHWIYTPSDPNGHHTLIQPFKPCMYCKHREYVDD